MELKIFCLKIKDAHSFVNCVHTLHTLPSVLPTCQAAALDLSERSPSLPPPGQQLNVPLLMARPVHFLVSFVLLCSSGGQNPMPPLSESNGPLQLVLLSQRTGDAFWRESIWVQGSPRLLTKNYLLPAGQAADISKALPT